MKDFSLLESQIVSKFFRLISSFSNLNALWFYMWETRQEIWYVSLSVSYWTQVFFKLRVSTQSYTYKSKSSCLWLRCVGFFSLNLFWKGQNIVLNLLFSFKIATNFASMSPWSKQTHSPTFTDIISFDSNYNCDIKIYWCHT